MITIPKSQLIKITERGMPSSEAIKPIKLHSRAYSDTASTIDHNALKPI